MVQTLAFYEKGGYRDANAKKILGLQQVLGKKNKPALLKGWGGCDRTLLVRAYKAILTLRVHRIMGVDYQTDRPFFCYKK